MSGRALWLAMLSLGLIACSGTGAPKRSITRVVVAGNQHVEADDLLEGTANHPPSGFIIEWSADYQPLELRLDQRRIESTYRERGYFSAKVLDAEVVEVNADEVAITFRVEEGPPSILEAVEVTGGPSEEGLGDRDLAILADLVLAKPVDYAAYEAGAERIRARLFSRGYAYVEVEKVLEIDRVRGAARVTYRIDSGPIAYFGEISVECSDDSHESLIRNRLDLETGERFDPVKLNRSKQRILATGLLGDVRFVWDKAKRSETLDLTIGAKEGLQHEIRLGAGVGVQRSFYELRSRAAYSHRNFIDYKSTLRAAVRPGLTLLTSGGFVGWNIEAEVALDREDFIWPLLKASWALEYGLTEIPAYSHQGPSARFTVGRLFLDDRVMTSIAAIFRHQSFLRIEPEVEALGASIGLDDPLTFVLIEPSIAFDGRDNLRSPRSGIFARVHLEVGRALSGEPRTYLKLVPEVRGYLPIHDRVVGAVRMRLGSRLLGPGTLPLTQRIFAGGPESQRGFGRDRLAPFVSDQEGERIPIGGETSIEVNAELRIALFHLWERQVSIVAFVDGADVANRASDLRIPGLHYAVGTGLRYDTPVGPVRGDIGFRLNRMGPTEPDSGSIFAVHLSLGEAF